MNYNYFINNLLLLQYFYPNFGYDIYPQHYMILTSTQLYRWFTNQFIYYYYNSITKQSNYIKRKLQPKTTDYYKGRKLAKRSRTTKHKLLEHNRTSHTIGTGTRNHINAFNSIAGCNDFLTFDSDSFPIIMDTGASCAMSMDKNDFIELTPHSCTISGLGNLDVQGRGTIKWNIITDDGDSSTLIWRNALYVPDLPIRLASPQQFLKQQYYKDKKSHYYGTKDSFKLSWNGMSLTIPYHPDSLMPIFYTRPGGDTYAYLSGTQNYREFNPPDSRDDESPEREKDSFDVEIDTTNTKNSIEKHEPNTPRITINYNETLSKAQRDLMHWHHKLGHRNMQDIQRLASLGFLPKHIANVPIPICQACQFGKAHAQPTGKKPIVDPNTKLQPGDLVHVDQAISSVPGRCLLHSGKPTNQTWKVVTIFKDHASKKVFAEFQRSTDAKETIQSKRRLESEAHQHGIKIKKYRADNGIFKSNAFIEDIEKLGQTIDYCGVGAHHQNGIAERTIRTIVESARTLLLHAHYKWNDTITFDLWTFALRQAVTIYNATPRKDLQWRTPNQVFAGVTDSTDAKDFNELKSMRTFGCPCYVLSTKSTNTQRKNKWTYKATKGIYLGKSRSHASNVALILNTKTKHISPQYHIVFDENFTTTGITENKMPENWDELFQAETWKANYDPNDYKTTHKLELDSNSFQQDWNNLFKIKEPSEGVWPTPQEETITKLSPASSTHSDKVSEGAKAKTPVKNTKLKQRNHKRTLKDHDVRDILDNHSRRLRRQNKRTRTRTTNLDLQALNASISELFKLPEIHNIIDNYDELNTLLDNTINELNPMAYSAAKAANPNILGHSDAMKSDDADKFWTTMLNEMERLYECDVYEIVDKSTVPAASTILRAVWSHRRKTRPDGQIYKHKSRVCADGSQQKKGIDFHETFSPVVAWSTVRFLLILALVKNLKMRQVDYVQAFTQAPLEDDVYMQIPAGFYVDNPENNNHKVIKLKKTLYGLSQASRSWFLTISAGLKSRGFRQSEIDPCLFIKDDIICLIYVDDTIFFARDDETINAMISDLQRDFDLTDEGDVEAFLGIKFQSNSKGEITMSQPGLIDSILEDVGIQATSKMHDTPATTPLLHKHEQGATRETKWDYRSVVGKLSYLCRNTRPDIEFAVHQCARFQTNPKQAHEKAIKRICRYLLKTRDKGITIKPSNDLTKLDCYVDADFAGAYTPSESHDPTLCRSRTGYVIMYANCPVLWASKLQTEIALSTVEAEYIALSTSLRELIPMRTLLLELKEILQIPEAQLQTHCTVFEDNIGAEELARTEKYRPRTKHIAIKYHHFRDHVRNGNILIQRIDTLNQLADIFTKPLNKQSFTKLRSRIQGWLSCFNKVRLQKLDHEIIDNNMTTINYSLLC